MAEQVYIDKITSEMAQAIIDDPKLAANVVESCRPGAHCELDIIFNDSNGRVDYSAHGLLYGEEAGDPEIVQLILYTPKFAGQALRRALGLKCSGDDQVRQDITIGPTLPLENMCRETDHGSDYDHDYALTI